MAHHLERIKILKQYTEYLKCEFTQEEINDAAKDLARAAQSRSTLEQRKKEVDASLKAQIEEQNSTIARLSQWINVGWEYRDVPCDVLLDTPEAGQKRIIRKDTGEEVKTALMTDQDKQMALDLQEKADAEERAKADAEADKPKQIEGPDGMLYGDSFTIEANAD